MIQEESYIKIFINDKNYDKEDLKYVFKKKIAKLSGEYNWLPHHEYFINYKKIYCIFHDFDINYETWEKIFKNYKI